MTVEIPFVVWLHFKYILNENSWDVTLYLTDGLIILDSALTPFPHLK